MSVPKYRIHLTPEERVELQRIAERPKTPQSFARRARIMLLADTDCAHQDIAETLGYAQPKMISIWTKWWLETASKPVQQRLQDAPRLGALATFSNEQVCRIIALACEPPENYARPITHWTHAELADEARVQGIVERISASQVGRLSKKALSDPTAAVAAATG